MINENFEGATVVCNALWLFFITAGCIILSALELRGGDWHRTHEKGFCHTYRTFDVSSLLCSASASPRYQHTNPVMPFCSWFSRVRDVTLIKWALKPTAPRPSPAPLVATIDLHLFRGGDGVCRGQVCGSCSYLWANTGCLFSAGKHRLLYKCTRRRDVKPDFILFTKRHVRLILLFAPQADALVSLLEDVRTADILLTPISPAAQKVIKPPGWFYECVSPRCYALDDSVFSVSITVQVI